MALVSPVETPWGFTAENAYHRIEAAPVGYPPGGEATVMLNVQVYCTAEACAAGATPIDAGGYSFPLADLLALASSAADADLRRAGYTLLKQKVAIREMEQRFSEAHYGRIGAGRPESVDSSSLHLDVLRDLKRINSHVTSVAYPILEEAGEISTSRLRTPERASDATEPAPGAERQ